MKLAILSYSSLVQRKILPALNKLGLQIHVDIYTRRDEIDAPRHPCFSNLSLTFKHRSEFDNSTTGAYLFVYISSANCNHSEDLALCSEYNHHVLIDKPAFLTSDECREHVNVYRMKQLYLQEVVVWQYHSQVSHIKDYIAINRPFSCLSLFLIPRLSPSNFRMLPLPGSGVFHDMNAYAFSLAALLGIPLHDINFDLPVDSKSNSTYFLATYGQSGITLTSIYGFGFPYVNAIHLSSGTTSLTSDRIFTTSVDHPPCLQLTTDVTTSVLDEVDDAFYNYFLEHIHTMRVHPVPGPAAYEKLLDKYTHPVFLDSHE